MKIDFEKCIGCMACHPYCTVGAIFATKWHEEPKSEVDQDACVECGACRRSEVCPREAIFLPELEWPRVARAQFGNPDFGHPQPPPGVPPAPDMKLNDIHELIGTDTADVVLEVGRPGVSTTFRDVQTLCSTLADMGVRVDPGTPVAAVMEDLERWRLKPEVLGERALSVMIQFRVSNERLGSILGALRAVSAELDTVCSISVVNRIKAGGEAPAAIISADAGFPVRVHSKINLGLGARLPEEE